MTPEPIEPDTQTDDCPWWAKVIGVLLCVAIFIFVVIPAIVITLRFIIRYVEWVCGLLGVT
jgi:uncharacterized membrane protein